MKRDTLVLLVALVCGALAFSLIFNFLKQASKPKNQFVMAKEALTKGVILTADNLTLSQPLQNISSANYYTQIYEVLNMELQEDVPTGKLISRDIVKPVEKKPEIVASPVDNTPVSLPVPPGMRALTLELQEVESIPIILKAGNYVDVLGYIPTGINNAQREIRTLLHGAQVLSTGKNEKQEIQSVTLAISPTYVEMLLNASKLGKVRLIVTNQPGGDASAWSTVGSIEIIRGIQRERKVT